jgi:hypothetical protein
MAPDVVNPRMVELEVAKAILAELFDIRTREVEEMIRQRMEDRMYSLILCHGACNWRI